MSKVVNIVGSSSNVGKTYLLEGLIKELKFRGYSIATIKHDVHGFDIDKKGKDTYKHREAGSETVIISSKNRLAMIKELEEEMLERINATGIGPGGLGGRTTALAVNINTYPTHIAGLPVAINICCHVNRHAVREL